MLLDFGIRNNTAFKISSIFDALSGVKLSPLRHRKGLVFKTVHETDPEHGASNNCYYLALHDLCNIVFKLLLA